LCGPDADGVSLHWRGSEFRSTVAGTVQTW
jgi:hypothetical protein